MREEPLVSIIIPTYNRAHLIGETLDSVLAQTYENWECIVVDDGSTDTTAELLASYVQKDARYQYHNRPSNRPKGANACRNYGFELSKGKFIQWLDSDDLLKENKLEIQVAKLMVDDPYALATCEWWSFEESTADSFKVDCKSAYLSYKRITNFLDALAQTHGYLPPHTYLSHRTLVSSASMWKEDLHINQDGEFMSRIFVNKPKVIFCDTAVFYRVSSSENTRVISSRMKAVQLIESWDIIKNNLSEIGVDESSRYVRQNLKYLKMNISNSFPDLITETTGKSSYIKYLNLKRWLFKIFKL